jgi:hypothetical protein
MSGRVMPLAYATGICGTHVRGADARTNERTDADNYSTCEDILLLSNAGATKPISLGRWAANQ